MDANINSLKLEAIVENGCVYNVTNKSYEVVDYKINITRNGEDPNSINIRQSLSYERFFKITQEKQYYELKCHFSTTNDLDKQLSSNSLFFREEITYRPLLEQINNIREIIKKCEKEYNKRYFPNSQLLSSDEYSDEYICNFDDWIPRKMILHSDLLASCG